MHPKDADRMTNGADPDQTLIWVCTVCPDLSVRKIKNITVCFVETGSSSSKDHETFIVCECCIYVLAPLDKQKIYSDFYNFMKRADKVCFYFG